jgi:hypothetical protein
MDNVTLYIQLGEDLFQTIKVGFSELRQFLGGQASTEADTAKLTELDTKYDALQAKEAAIANQG